MRRLFLALWALPWPDRLRRVAEQAVQRMWLQRVLVPRFLVGVVGLIENDRGDVLLLRHTYRHEFPWGLPSGFLEHREQPHEALRREICEETGFVVDLSAIWKVYTDPKRPLLNLVIRGSFRGGTFGSNAEVSEARFFPLDDLPPLLPDQLRLLEAGMAQEVPH